MPGQNEILTPMPAAASALARHRVEIARLCQTLGVRRLSLFGSATRHDFDDRTSDFDFIVEFGDIERHGLRDPYFRLKRSLQEMLGRSVDLVEWGAVVNPVVREHLAQQQVVVYAA